MLSRPHNDTENSLKLGSTTAAPSRQKYDIPKHTSLSQAELNARAPDFVPGAQASARHETSAENGHNDAIAQDYTEEASKGTHPSPGADGAPDQAVPHTKKSDLSKALRSSQNGHAAQQPAQQARSQHTMAYTDRNPDAAILGKSPSSRMGYSSANHLLNFQYQSHQRGRGGGGPLGARSRAGSGRRAGPRPQPYNRNKFLQANFRFLVSDAADLRRHEADADLMLDWDDVIQVEMLTAQEIKCPISLEAPVCPQITPCGHVFAFPSILVHLMNHGGDNLRKASPCPLCFQPIVARELRLVQISIVTPPKAGDTVTFSLLKRPRHGIIPQEVAGERSENAEPAPAQEKEDRQSPPIPMAVWAGKSPPAPDATAAASSAVQDTAAMIRVNPFAKFGAISDATPLWRSAAEQLSTYAAEVTTEGGFDAAMEAPYIYAAIDALAVRAGKWAERRQRLLQEASPDELAMPSPEAAAAAAITAVKEMTTAASESAKSELARRTAAEARAAADAAAKAALVRDFPSLQPATPSPAHPHRGWEGAHAAAARTQGVEAAFSDNEFEPLVLQYGNAEGATPSRTDASSPSGPKDAAVSEQPEAQGIPIKVSEPPKAPDAAGSATSVTSVLGSSPGEQATFLKSNEYYFYQASDGQWLFLTALDVRILLAHYGAYGALPGRLAAQVVNIDNITQTEVMRKKIKFLGHLPLTGAFQLAEVDLNALLPEETLAPFADELQSRNRRRERRVQEEAQQSARDAKQAAARAAALAASTAGPTAAQLKAMPLPSASLRHFLGGLSEEEALTNALTASLAEDSSGEEEAAAAGDEAATPQTGISFAKMTAMGFAATGPSLPASSPGGTSGTSPGALQRPAWGKPQAQAPAQRASQPGAKPQAWGVTTPRQQHPGLSSPAQTAPISWLEPASLPSHGQESKGESAAGGQHHSSPAPKDEVKESSGKKKKGQKQQTLLFTTTQRRY